MYNTRNLTHVVFIHYHTLPYCSISFVVYEQGICQARRLTPRFNHATAMKIARFQEGEGQCSPTLTLNHQRQPNIVFYRQWARRKYRLPCRSILVGRKVSSAIPVPTLRGRQHCNDGRRKKQGYQRQVGLVEHRKDCVRPCCTPSVRLMRLRHGGRPCSGR